MYESFYGLTGKPFQLNPDPSFYFGSRQHKRAMAYLEYGIHQNEGFIVITGEIGAGKTTLVRNLFNKLDPATVVAANLVSTQLDAEDTLRMVAAAFGIPSAHADKSGLLLALEGFFVSTAQQGKRCLLVVDEAQNLTQRAVEELRMLSNFQLETHALLQSFLIGQPEFRAILQSPHMQQLRQRVIAACHIGPMDPGETKGYIEHRLRCVGWVDSPQFTPEAFAGIFAASGGIPRRINSLCDRLLLFGFLAGKRAFTREDVFEVAADLNDETNNPHSAQAADTEWTSAPPLADKARESSMPSPGSKAQPDPQPTNYGLNRDELAARLLRVEENMLRIERGISRLERSHASNLGLLVNLIDRLRARDASAGKALENISGSSVQ
jgi:general secretion pathway protein A